MTDVITTERLTLRAPEMGDVAALVPLINTLDVARWLTRVPHPYSDADGREFVARNAAGQSGSYLVFHDGTLVGGAGVGEQLGYWFGVPHWGKGYATEAARALVAQHFADSKASLRSGYFVGNARSAHVLEKLGFEPTEIVDTGCLALGQSRALQHMSLSHTRWEAWS